MAGRSSPRFGREYIELIVITVMMALVIRAFVVSVDAVRNNSMGPDLRFGDSIFVYKLPFSLGLPFVDKTKIVLGVIKRGDVVVFQIQGDDFVKRVVALPGDRVTVDNGRLMVNGSFVQGFSDLPSNESLGPTIIPPREVLLFGDNPDVLHNWQTVPIKDLRGQAFLTWLSIRPKQRGIWPSIDWQRSFRTVQ